MSWMKRLLEAVHRPPKLSESGEAAEGTALVSLRDIIVRMGVLQRPRMSGHGLEVRRRSPYVEWQRLQDSAEARKVSMLIMLGEL